MSEQTNIVLWAGRDSGILPKKADVPEIVNLGLQLSEKDQRQIIGAYEMEAYEMLANFIWTKTVTTLKHQLSKMGVTFIAEMLDRPDLDEDSNLQKEISEYEAIKLAEELGIINGTGSFRLKQAMDTIAHFNENELEYKSEDEMSEDEVKLIVRSCVGGVLGYEKIEAAIDFKNFRDDLENELLDESNPQINKLILSPYFFHRTTVRILLAIIKSAIGAKLETSLANANLLIPKLWDGLKDPEKYQIGRCYSELNSDGKTSATKGMKSVLLKVKGFDFVPEDLRSISFINAAEDVLRAHENFNNFYNEPAPMRHLQSMGNVIPAPAFAKCMTAVLSVKLGNAYGVSGGAQDYADKMIKNISRDRWVYYFKNCLEVDDRILRKLSQENPLTRFSDLFEEEFLDDVITQISSEKVIRLLEHIKNGNLDKVEKLARSMYYKLGYGVQ